MGAIVLHLLSSDPIVRMSYVKVATFLLDAFNATKELIELTADVTADQTAKKQNASITPHTDDTRSFGRNKLVIIRC